MASGVRVSMSSCADALVEGVPGNQGAGAAPVFDAVAVAGVGGQFLVAAEVVADGHPQPAASADDDALQQRGAFAGRPGGAVAAVRGGVGRQLGDVGLVLVQGDVSGVGAGDEGGPLVAGQLPGGVLPAGQDPLGGPAVGERAGVAGVVQHPQHGVVAQRLPVDLAFAGAFLVPPGEGQAGGAERLHDGGGRPGGLEGGEQVPQRALDGGVGVEDDVPGGVVDQADGQRHDELAAAGLGELPAAQPGPDEMELGLREGALKAQEESVVEVPAGHTGRLRRRSGCRSSRTAVRSARGAVLAFRPARFPGPPPEPAVRVVPATGSPQVPAWALTWSSCRCQRPG